MRLLILGGYGVFGGRLAELLSDIADLEIIIAGRTLAKAETFCRNYRGLASVSPLRLDRNMVKDRIAEIEPSLIVDASGPFQNYGEDAYGVLEACIEAKIPYLDLADGSDFVSGVAKYDDAARKAGIFALSGVSSFPVLSAAVLKDMSRDMDIKSVTGGVTPSPHAGIGLNVMRAVLNYAGGPVTLKRDGEWIEAMGLTESRRYTVAPPGKLPLRNIHFSLVDVPDLQVVPKHYETLESIWIGAGPVPEILHRALNVFARLRAMLRLPSLEPLAPLFHRTLNLLKFGEHRGGMVIHAVGLRDGQQIERSWHLLAEGDDGPYIPSIAVEAIIRKMLAGTEPKTGARAAIHEVSLEDYDQLFKTKTIVTGFRDQADPKDPIYRRVLDRAYEKLPSRVQQLHGTKEPRMWKGQAEVIRGGGFLSKVIAALVGFPQAADRVPVSVTFTPQANGELWTRNFGGREFRSFQSQGKRRNEHLLLEKFGAITVALALVVDEDRLRLIPRNWRFLGVPLPRFLLPRGESFETEKDGDFRFDVEISAPVVGMIVAYKGWLKPESETDIKAAGTSLETT